MTLFSLQSFLGWCSILNIGLLMFWIVILAIAPDLVFRTQRRWFPMSREVHGVVMYGMLGLFKLLVLVFNVIPYIAIRLVNQ